MKKVRINITEYYQEDDLDSTLFLLVKDDVEDIEGTLQKAYNEYITKILDYKDDEDAKDNGVYFGNSFKDIPKELSDKYGFEFVDPDVELHADFDYGFGMVR